MNRKEIYESPSLTVVEFKVERGYAESGAVAQLNNVVGVINDQVALTQMELTAADMGSLGIESNDWDAYNNAGENNAGYFFASNDGSYFGAWN